MITIGRCFVLLSLLTINSGVKAQVSWKVTHTDADSNYTYHFTSVSCNGNDCTAGALLQDLKTFHMNIVFYRSYDGGKTWHLQDPNLPYQFAESQNKILHIQQIDSLNVVGLGDSGLIVRTFDGGNTWIKQDCHTLEKLLDVSFSDPLNGIVTSAGYSNQIHVTIDGGRTWKDIDFNIILPMQCYCSGPGKFKILKYVFGPVYSTVNNFATIDSSAVIFDGKNDSFNSIVTNMNFTAGDTMIGYGSSNDTATGKTTPLIVHTTDGGAHWSQFYIPPGTSIIKFLTCMTPVTRDTVFAAGAALFHYLYSIDHGFSWKVDTVILDTNYGPYMTMGMSITGDGHPIAIVNGTDLLGHKSILVRGERISSRVEAYERIIYHSYIFPNPASQVVTISSIDVSRPIDIIDILGRQVFHGVLSENGKLQVNVSNFSPGLYEVVLDHFGQRLAVGKIAVTGK